MRRSTQMAFVAITLLLAANGAIAATPPGLIHYQGVLRDANDAPLSGSFDMVFRLYDAPAGGQEILVDSHTSGLGGQVVVSGGLFSAEIGGGDITDGAGPGTYLSLSDAFRDHAGAYLQVEVSGEILLPRTRVLSSAYALNADRLDGVDAGDLAAAVHAHDGTDITTGKVANARLNTGSGNGIDADTVDGLHASELVPATTNLSLASKAIRQGATLFWESVSQIRIKPGILGFPDGKVRETSVDLVWDFANGTGDLGLDTGIEAANTWYYLYAVPDDGDDDAFTVIASTGSPAQAGGAGPAGYAVHRFVGSFRNGSLSDIRKFYREGTGVHWDEQTFWVQSCVGFLPAVNAWVTVDASGDQPVTSRAVDLAGYYRVDCGTNFVEWHLAPGTGPVFPGFLPFCLNAPTNATTTCELTLPTVDQEFSYYAAQGGGVHQACHCALLGYLGYEEDLSEF